MREYIWFFWDIVAFIIVALAVWGCARKGFLRTAVGFISAIASAAAAGFLSAPLALFLYEAVVRDAIRAVISRQVAGQLEGGLASAADWLSAVPDWAARMVPPGASLSAPISPDDVIPAVEELISAALADPVLMILRGLCFFLLFSVFLAIGRFISHSLGVVNRLPLIGWSNTMLGGALGIGQAVVVLYLMAVAAWFYIAASGGGSAYLNEFTLSEGYLFSFFFRLAA